MIPDKKELAYDKTGVKPSALVARLDEGLGDIVKCECLDNEVVDNYDPCLPTKLGARLRVTYANGQTLECCGRLCEVLFFGLARAYGDVDKPSCLANPRLLAFIGSNAAELKEVPVGEVQLPDANEAKRLMDRYGIPVAPIYDEDRPTIEKAWFDAWKKSGLLCMMRDGVWLIDAALPEEAEGHRYCHYVNGKEVCYPGATPYVELCDETIKPTEELADDECGFVADVWESPVNAGWVDGKKAYELFKQGKRYEDVLEPAYHVVCFPEYWDEQSIHAAQAEREEK